MLKDGELFIKAFFVVVVEGGGVTDQLHLQM